MVSLFSVPTKHPVIGVFLLKEEIYFWGIRLGDHLRNLRDHCGLRNIHLPEKQENNRKFNVCADTNMSDRFFSAFEMTRERSFQ
ncbi:hypothetical protein [Aquiflexum gelatinilyticum]|uniref:hypothetical protein n=1 Tax=Aquiflexum gelatinilyticum TaxID=2961943 RepID=UPI0021674684|nr:hypothetical protein [Aquiflexum gelatinilyticum]MCS4435303.1 hypothetical protein [Aquiflexum gelatinilyticum]